MNLEESNNIGGPSDADLNQDMDGGLRRSTRKNKGVPSERLGFESTSQSAQNLEETLIQLEIEKTQAQLTIIELKEKQTRMMLEKEKGSRTSQESTSPNDDVLQGFLPFERAGGLKTKCDARDGDKNVVSERFAKTLYTKFFEDLRGKANHKETTDPLTPDAARFSSWTRLLRATAFVMKTAKNWLAKVKGTRAKDDQSSAKLTVNDLQSAEKRLWREMQTKYLPEITRLREGKEIDSKSSLYKLSPFVDREGVLRMNSRLVNSPEDVEKFPVILDPKHPATKLLILDAHERNLHQGREQIVNNLREQFWIPGIRQAVKGSWRDCQTCCNHTAQPKPPRMAPLPTARVEGNLFLFTRTGVDFFGPIMVTKGRRQEKRWGVLFTCMATRAIHLEIAHSLSTDSAIMAIRRFISRRGPVRELFSDNGTNFHGADKEMREALMQIDNEKIRDTLSAKFIEWSFNPPAAPHMGGCWERLIRSVKTALKATLAFHSPTDEILQTIFAEIEYIVNNRPLTHVSIDPSDPMALTPNHFLLGRNASQLHGDFDDKDLCLRMAWRKSQRLIDMFWQRWIREYLPELSRRTKWFEDVPPIEKGSVVIIADGNLPRNEWPLGVIEEVFPGPDENIRSAAVRTTKGLYKRSVIDVITSEGKDGDKAVLELHLPQKPE
uniref:Integrase catalytic domain-containing protein n=1 Tax=Phlebotomus papatasi TaxID=29031 RepID=A0A1B0D7Y5_PHLPP